MPSRGLATESGHDHQNNYVCKNLINISVSKPEDMKLTVKK